MEWIRNFPLFCIVLSLFTGVLCSALKGKWAKNLSYLSISLILGMSAAVMIYALQKGDAVVYMMGHFPAPWGNEIRIGVLEALMAVTFCIIMVLSLMGGHRHIFEDVEPQKVNFYYVLANLMMSSLLALVYTNDLFTAYVFVEINTIAACGLIMIRSSGHTMVASVKYMIMSLLGSGLILIGISMLYGITGHLLMSDLFEAVTALAETGQYDLPLTAVVGLISVGLAMKSALFPFHSWLPDAYGFSTPSSSAILSSLASKGYIFLLIKLYYRVFGTELIVQTGIDDVLYLFGIIGMIMGSVSAIKQTDMRRLIAFSSIAQIGYIYMSIGLGSEIGFVAAVFHILSHGATKSMLFIAASGLSDVSHQSKDFTDLRGSAHRNKVAGFTFAIGAFSMVGLPLLAGFTSKLYFASAAIQNDNIIKMLLTMIVLAISTILNAVYFIRATITIYRPERPGAEAGAVYHPSRVGALAMVLMIGLNLFLGIGAQYVTEYIAVGLRMFGA